MPNTNKFKYGTFVAAADGLAYSAKIVTAGTTYSNGVPTTLGDDLLSTISYGLIVASAGTTTLTITLQQSIDNTNYVDVPTTGSKTLTASALTAGGIAFVNQPYIRLKIVKSGADNITLTGSYSMSAVANPINLPTEGAITAAMLATNAIPDKITKDLEIEIPDADNTVALLLDQNDVTNHQSALEIAMAEDNASAYGIKATGAFPLRFYSADADDANTKSYIFNTPALANAAARIISVQNNTSEKFFILQTGAFKSLAASEIEIADTSNTVALTLDQNDVTNHQSALEIAMAEDHATAYGITATGAFPLRFKSADADDANTKSYIFDTVALTNAAAKIISVQNNTSEKFYILQTGAFKSLAYSEVEIADTSNTDGFVIDQNDITNHKSALVIEMAEDHATAYGITATGAFPLRFKSADADDANTKSYIFDTVALTNAAAKIISVQNNTSEKFYILQTGAFKSLAASEIEIADASNTVALTLDQNDVTNHQSALEIAMAEDHATAFGITATGAFPLRFKSADADDANCKSYIFDTVALANASAQILSLQNNTTEVFGVLQTGALTKYLKVLAANGNVGSATLSAGAGSTAIANTSVTANTRVVLTATSATAAADVGSATGVYISAINAGVGFTITHPNTADVDKTFDYHIFN